MKIHTLNVLLFFLLIPYPSKQHFIWPLHWCLLADICNHTWIPECGAEDDIPANRKLFIDECDMYEFNCDFERDFEPINYSDCFNIATGCPVTEPCPAIPNCPDHRLVKKGKRFTYVKTPYPDRRMGRRRRTTTQISLPKHMLKGRRRYTPWHTRTVRKSISKTKVTREFTTVVLKTEVVKNGKRMMKIIKKMFKTITKKQVTENDFLE